MRWAGLLCGIYLLIPLMAPRIAQARPEFARREGLACGYCHIQPRGGGPRNANGLTYARNEFKFPEETGTLNSFENGRERDAMVRARKMLRINHIGEAHQEFAKLAKKLPDGPAKTLVEAELHTLEVRGDEVLGEARLLLRKSKPKDRETGVEMLLVLATEYKGLPAREKALADLKELKRDKTLKEVLEREQQEEKARLMLLDALALKVDGKPGKAAKSLEKLTSKYPDSRAAKQAAELAAETESNKKPEE